MWVANLRTSFGFDAGFKFWFRFSKENKLVSTVVGFAIGFVGNSGRIFGL